MTENTDTRPWYETYFNSDYLLIDEQSGTADETRFMAKVLRLRRGTRFLDAACGYGRHLLPLLDRGVRAYGCDLSAFMLGEAATAIREKSLPEDRLVRCDLRSMPFRDTFQAAAIMFNSFGYFDAEDDNFRVLRAVADALKPGGRFLLDLVNRDFVLRSMAPKDWFEHGDALILERKWYDPFRNRSEIDVHVVDTAGKRTYHHSIRLYSFTEISMLLQAAGLDVVEVYGGFNGEEFDRYHDRMLILARAAGREIA